MNRIEEELKGIDQSEPDEIETVDEVTDETEVDEETEWTPPPLLSASRTIEVNGTVETIRVEIAAGDWAASGGHVSAAANALIRALKSDTRPYLGTTWTVEASLLSKDFLARAFNLPIDRPTVQEAEQAIADAIRRRYNCAREHEQALARLQDQLARARKDEQAAAGAAQGAGETAAGESDSAGPAERGDVDGGGN